jgi:hypothetical protein
MNSPVGGHYTGAGITLGLALTFGYLAAMSIAGNRQAEVDSNAYIPTASTSELRIT